VSLRQVTAVIGDIGIERHTRRFAESSSGMPSGG
jgi:hypothetical protein